MFNYNIKFSFHLICSLYEGREQLNRRKLFPSLRCCLSTRKYKNDKETATYLLVNELLVLLKQQTQVLPISVPFCASLTTRANVESTFTDSMSGK